MRRLPSGRGGAIVSNVSRSSPAFNAGVVPNDVILEVNRKAVSSVTQVKRALDDAARRRVDFALRSDLLPMPEALLRAALATAASLAVVPVQDLLGLGSEARFNTPGTPAGNWRWRLWQGALNEGLAAWCLALNQAFGRETRA